MFFQKVSPNEITYKSDMFTYIEKFLKSTSNARIFIKIPMISILTPSKLGYPMSQIRKLVCNDSLESAVHLFYRHLIRFNTSVKALLSNKSAMDQP